MRDTVVGASLPTDSRIWRNSAHFSRDPILRCAGAAGLCDADPIAAVPQVIPAVQYHFRTPSPGGQPASQAASLPTTFLHPAQPRSLHALRRFSSDPVTVRRRFAQFSPAATELLCTRRVAVPRTRTNSGDPSCVRKLVPSRLQLCWALPPVVTRSASRPSLAVPLAPVQPRSQAAMLSQVPPLARQATCWPANSTSRTAEPTPRPVRRVTDPLQRRCAPGRSGVLRLTTQPSEAPCSRNC